MPTDRLARPGPAIEIAGLRKTHHGDVEVVCAIDLTVQLGEVTGAPGPPHGAGDWAGHDKTTADERGSAVLIRRIHAHHRSGP
jgi:hypothetical protein